MKTFDFYAIWLAFNHLNVLFKGTEGEEAIKVTTMPKL